MLYIIRDLMFIFLSIIGIIEIVRAVVLYFMKTKNDNDVFIVVPVYGHNDSVEILLRHTAARVKWFGGTRINKVLCLDCNTDNETKTICKKICDEYSFMEFKESIEINSSN